MTLRLLGWGMVVAFVTLPLNGFDLLPDVVGWVMLLAALWTLAGGSVLLERARIAGIVGVASSALAFAAYFSEQRLAWLDLLSTLVELACWTFVVTWLMAGLARRATRQEPVAALRARQLARIAFVANLVVVGFHLVRIAFVAAGLRRVLTTSGPMAWLALLVELASGVVDILVVAFCFRHADCSWVLRDPGRRELVEPSQD